jgi:chromosomal replication initiation ATPase DnaA
VIARQLVFDLGTRQALGRAEFHVTPANAAALDRIERHADWPDGKLALTGPGASGKTHLVQVWAAATGAAVVAAAALAALDVGATVTARSVAVEDVPDIAGDPVAEAALLHLHNLLISEGGRLLLTGRGAPARWGLRLPDLASRVAATLPATLDAPDDALLAALLAKRLADRQVTTGPDVIAYLVARMTRSAAAAVRLADRLDALSLAEGRPVTRPLAARALALDLAEAEATASPFLHAPTPEPPP